MSNTNNNVGRNEPVAKVCDDIHFDLAPVSGTDTLGTRTGQEYDIDALKAIILARGAEYADATGFALTDDLTEIEVDLKPIGGEGYNEGDDAQFATATTSDASYVNNGSRTDIDPSGGREDGEDVTMQLPTSVDSVWVCNGSILTVHVTFCKEGASK